MSAEWLADLLANVATALDTSTIVVKGVLAVVLVCLLCGLVGSLVVGNRMAFFSDAMAHCAFAGIALGLLTLIVAQVRLDDESAAWLVPLIMVGFGVAVGAGIVYVREQTNLANDTVIGVFFAFAIGFGAMLLQGLQQVGTFNPEGFLFGSPLFVPEVNLLFLMALLLVVGGLYGWRYNQIVFASFNPSLARTRRVSLRLNNYLLIVVLALVVNLSISAVGALLINALLVVPAATASNVARNLRQMFWLTVLFCLASGLVGFWLSLAVSIPMGAGRPLKFGPSGTIVVAGVAMFFLSMVVPFLRKARRSPAPAR